MSSMSTWWVIACGDCVKMMNAKVRLLYTRVCVNQVVKKCITLPGVNKPRGRALDRISPLLLPLLYLLRRTTAPYSHLRTPTTDLISLSFSLIYYGNRDRRHRRTGHPQIIFSRRRTHPAGPPPFPHPSTWSTFHHLLFLRDAFPALPARYTQEKMI